MDRIASFVSLVALGPWVWFGGARAGVSGLQDSGKRYGWLSTRGRVAEVACPGVATVPAQGSSV